MKPKKSLGQNFLKSELALKKIIEAGEIKKDDIILEIGPGRGALTEKLLATGCQLIAVEKDRALYEMLKTKYQKQVTGGKLVLVDDDILNFNLESYKLVTTSYKIIANIPYNITGAILKKFLTEKHQPTSMVLMVQKEVARRMVAQDGKESILSISVKAYGEPKIVMKVPARYFSPKPKVDSMIISIKNISRKIFENSGISEEKFWEIVKAGFAHKRKKLASNLKNITSLKGELLVNLGNKRAEDLTLQDWILLSK